VLKQNFIHSLTRFLQQKTDRVIITYRIQNNKYFNFFGFSIANKKAIMGHYTLKLQSVSQHSESANE
jgi:hypothetical protein